MLRVLLLNVASSAFYTAFVYVITYIQAKQAARALHWPSTPE